MGAPQYEQAGADIGGTGTTNTIPRWTGPSTLGDSGLIDDSTSIYTSTRRVGVDTSTTLTNIKLQVGTAASLANYQGAPLGVVLPAGSGSWLELAENSASGTSFRISKDSSTGVVLNTNGKTIGFTAAGYTTAISSSQVVLTTSGNVGIGTTVPASFISTNSTVLAVGGAGNLGTVRVSNTANFSGNHAEFFAGASNVGIWGSSNCPMLFYTNNNERVRIDSNGNIYGTSGTTGMTNGFFYIPAAAGAPTGTPTAVSGRVPMYYDTTNNEFYVYNGAWKKVTLA